MGEPIGDAPTAPKAKPTILVPPRGSIFANGSGPGFSPGPTTMVSSLKFPEQGPFSFSQLLAGAMASPLAAAQPQQQLESLSPLFMLNSPGYLSPLQTPFGMSHQQALAHVTAQAALSQSFKQMQAGFHHSSSKHPLEPSTNHKSDTLRQHATSPLPSEPETSKLESIPEKSQSDEKTGDKDGYSWRKYGQKHVKTSEYPRSYYKCTHLNCPVKKKVEKTLDGRVSGFTYKGEHNHDLPNHNKQGKDSCALDTTSMASQGGIETNGSKEDLNVRSECADFQVTTKMVFEDNSNNCDKEDSAIIVDKANEDEPIAKRRSLDIGPSVPSHQALSEPKIVLRTRSEVDLLDDGYKWRKYGQKVVKGNPYPRSYYRCTYAGCNVRKHVERASADPKAVITTYEGKHNHDVPTGRHISSHGGASSSSQQLKTQKTGPENPSINEETDYGDRDDIPTTLQPKEEQIAA